MDGPITADEPFASLEEIDGLDSTDPQIVSSK